MFFHIQISYIRMLYFVDTYSRRLGLHTLRTKAYHNMMMNSTYPMAMKWIGNGGANRLCWTINTHAAATDDINRLINTSSSEYLKYLGYLSFPKLCVMMLSCINAHSIKLLTSTTKSTKAEHNDVAVVDDVPALLATFLFTTVIVFTLLVRVLLHGPYSSSLFSLSLLSLFLFHLHSHPQLHHQE